MGPAGGALSGDYGKPMNRWRRDALISQAVELLAGVPEYIWDGERLPVPVEEIADSHLGLLVREADDLSDAPGLPDGAADSQLSGLLLVGRREIWVNAAEARRWPRRRRYTVAHEVAHWVLHRSDGVAVRCRAADVTPAGVPMRVEEEALSGRQPVAFFDDGVGDAGGPRLDAMEDEANVFAGALLMPPHLMRQVYDQSGGDLERVADAFECSLSAVSPRWHGLYAYRAPYPPW